MIRAPRIVSLVGATTVSAIGIGLSALLTDKLIMVWIFVSGQNTAWIALAIDSLACVLLLSAALFGTKIT